MKPRAKSPSAEELRSGRFYATYRGEGERERIRQAILRRARRLGVQVHTVSIGGLRYGQMWALAPISGGGCVRSQPRKVKPYRGDPSLEDVHELIKACRREIKRLSGSMQPGRVA